MKAQTEIKRVEFTCALTKQVVQHNIHPSFIGFHEKYPFPYLLNHIHPDNGKEILSVLYLDENYCIVDYHSKYLNSNDKSPIIQEILQLEEEYKRLYKKYKDNINDLKYKISHLKSS